VLLRLATALTALALAPAGSTDPTSERGRPDPLRGQRIAIDPGHNEKNGAHPEEINKTVAIGNGERKACDTVGTQTASGYPEHAYTMSVARKLKRLLRAEGARVKLTRKNDKGVGPCINRRARIGNRFDAHTAASIHADGGPPSGRGFHVIYSTRIQGLTDDIYKPSKKLARSLRNAYAKRTGLPPSTYAGSKGLDARSDLGGLRLSNVPKVFIETGNMQNHADAHDLERSTFRKRIARGIRDGVRRFLNDR
jgi:N-acetylmuramoyl-L-alanine amidase